VDALFLRFPNHEHDDLVLSPGVHAVGRDDGGIPTLVDDVARGIAQFCVDRRGVWLQLRDGIRGVHVNGRPVRHMAMLRMGDAIYIDGYQLSLVGPEPPPPSDTPFTGEAVPVQGPASQMVLRGVGGVHHGRSITLDRPRLVGRLRSCDIRIDEPAFAERHARLEPHAEGIVLRDLGSDEGSVVNGRPVRHALLSPGSQVVFDAQNRFVIEAPTTPPHPALSGHLAPMERAQPDRTGVAPPMIRPGWRMPWLLLAALLLAGALSLLLLYGAR
jgi:hypothetical protein